MNATRHTHGHKGRPVAPPAPEDAIPIPSPAMPAELLESLDLLSQKLDSFSGALTELFGLPQSQTKVNTTVNAGSAATPADEPAPWLGLQGSAAKAGGLLDLAWQTRGYPAQRTSAFAPPLGGSQPLPESDAAIHSAPPELSDIINRLRELEEQQRNLQSQFSISR